jgi:hypothetical protein
MDNNKILKKEEKCLKRKVLLTKALTKAGLELREDSKLCKKYISGEIKENKNNIVERMCQMRYLFEYCNMNECKEEAYNNQIEIFNAGYFPDCSVFEEAEFIALDKYSNGKYPKIFPWMK